MPRDNSKHIGLPETGEVSSETPQPQQFNPMQFWNSSTEFVELPSKGAFYQDHLSSGKVEIKDMTAFHEDILSNRNYITEGVLFDKFIKAICAQDVDPLTLLTGDRTAIMIAARSAAYGNKFNTKIKCPACQTTNHIDAFLQTPTDENPVGNLKVNHGCLDEDILSLFDASVDYDKRVVTFKLQSGIEIKVRLMDGNLEKSLAAIAAFKKKNKQGTGELTSLDQMLQAVESIGGHVGTAERQQILGSMPASESLYFKSAYKALSPSINILINQECSNSYCDNVIEQEVGLSPDFFWPKL